MRSYQKDTKNKRKVRLLSARLVRLIRLHVNISQADLAIAMGIDLHRISNVERGQVTLSLSMLYELADALDFSPAAFVGLIHTALIADVETITVENFQASKLFVSSPNDE